MTKGASMPTTAKHTPAGKDVPRQRHLPGEEGMWVFIFGDMTVFAMLFGVYLYYRGADTAEFNQSQLLLNQTFGVVNTLVLLTSSLLVVTALRAVRGGALELARRLLYGAMACGVVFIVNKAIEYGEKISMGLVPATNEFFMYFYVMTGLHLLHVVIGLALLWFMVTLTRRPARGERQQRYLEGAACFWHMVDLLWIVIFPLLYLVK
ncbi:cytochrome c oxidase subunit 3 [Mycolicibacterium neoaurum]|uniref:cytochrome c oxidase subunit 3 n=1 Tax=Mycolicibacterium neoaurum TaxID=1795 RepID=UPI00248BBC38|nr:cytochrome c oxidase subunit 3 [Mycolicibacterium neoaurum]MDO3399492.1 cytochrome c oxidase subunit 3 [Mycolicibacterium neoaurum]WBP96956.1 cytochrome c oxidase subunit 3 [Mycolicibacterium neoaurum]WBS10764.1 cytochrome c oxidase subunit 3 [Mycolicibacterium neoaurum]